jgi:hypothetical protein
LSSFGSIWSNFSITVTFEPRRLKTCANSIPMGPAPRTVIDSGRLSSSRAVTFAEV